MTPLVAKVIWLIGVVGWFVIRYPHQRRSRRTPKRLRSDRTRELVLMAVSSTGLGIIPAVYVATGFPAFADYAFRPWQACGAAVFAGSLGYSAAQGPRAQLVGDARGPRAARVDHPRSYSRVRHPMYSAFWLWAIAQALLLPNWIAGPAGLVGFGTLFFLRIGREERMMLEIFGEDYRRYVERTARVRPGFFEPVPWRRTQKQAASNPRIGSRLKDRAGIELSSPAAGTR